MFKIQNLPAIITNKAKTILVIMLIIFIALLSNISNFQLDASSDSLVLEGDADLLYYQQLRKIYPSDENIIISYQVQDNLLSAKNLNNLTKFTQELQAISSVKNITSILTVPLFASPQLSIIDLAGDGVSIKQGNADLKLAQLEFKNSPIYSENLVSLDGKTTAILVAINNKDISQTIKNIRQIITKHQTEAVIFVGGLPLIINDIIDYIGSDLVIFSLIVIAIMAIILLLIFRSLRFMLLPIISSIIVALSMSAILAWFDWKVTVISSNFFSLLLVMTLSIMIHLIVRYREIAPFFTGSKNELIQATLTEMFHPCFYTTITTLIAFVSLLISGIRPVIDFGYMMSIGVVLAFILSFLLFPAIMSILPKMDIKPSKTEFSATKIFATIVDKFGKYILIVATILVLFSIYGISKITVENRFIDYFKSSTEIHQGLSVIDENLGGTIPLEIIFENLGADYFYDDVIREEIEKVHKYLQTRPEIGKVLSIDTMMQILTGANDGDRPSGFMLNIIKSQIPEQAKQVIYSPYINEDNGQIRIVARVREGYPNLQRNELIKSINNDLIAMGFAQDSFHINGIMVLYNNMLQSLFDSQIKTIGVVFLMIWLMFLLLFRSFTIATIALIPNILPSILILGIMGVLGIPLDLMTITIAAIAIGIGVDDAIHYLSRFKTELQKTADYRLSMFGTHASIGLAMFYTSITIALGFVVLVFSNFIPSLYFGLFTAIAMFSAVVLNLTLLPKLLLLFKPKF